MSGNNDSQDLFEGNWSLRQIMNAYDHLPPDIRAAIAYADDQYSVEELFVDPRYSRMPYEELLQFLWESSDGFEIRYPYHVRIQYERTRAASYRNHYVSGWDLGRDSVEVLHGRDPFGPLR